MMKYMMIFMGLLFFKVASRALPVFHRVEPVGDRRTQVASQIDASQELGAGESAGAARQTKPCGSADRRTGKEIVPETAEGKGGPGGREPAAGQPAEAAGLIRCRIA